MDSSKASRSKQSTSIFNVEQDAGQLADLLDMSDLDLSDLDLDDDEDADPSFLPTPNNTTQIGSTESDHHSGSEESSEDEETRGHQESNLLVSSCGAGWGSSPTGG
ncbi:uncharacterized protein LOC120354886 [Nilaparvata lugens]|uniref:uncharacterized protein LOC120354886 n=1 Tax=Nilaparvata lugens TaxID=108931 RepID=UPI00193CE9CD|nr:uncharacterized protein LOC120354886 [Nilaparvata lugens]